MSQQEIDCEQLLKQVLNEDARRHLSEAIKCYLAKAYGASVVMTACAVSEDLRVKARNFKPFDGTAGRVSDRVEASFAKHKSYEAELFRELARSKLLPETEQQWYLRDLLTARNRAAHASGIDTLPEFAAMFINKAVTLILAKRLLAGQEAIPLLLDRMRRINMFPQSCTDYASIALAELDHIDPRIYFFLIEEIAKAIDVVDDKLFVRNAGIVLECFARDRDFKFRAKLAEELLQNRTLPSSSTWVLDVIAADPLILARKVKNPISADAVVGAIIASAEETPERLYQLEAILRSLLDDALQSDHCERYRQTVAALCERLWLRPVSLELAGDKEWVRKIVEEALLQRTADHEGANLLLQHILNEWLDDEEECFGRRLSSETALRLVVNIWEAGDAGRTHCSHTVAHGFLTIPYIRDKAIAFLRDEEDAAWQILDVDDNETGPSPEEFIERYINDKFSKLEPGVPTEEEQEESRKSLQQFRLKLSSGSRGPATLQKAC